MLENNSNLFLRRALAFAIQELTESTAVGFIENENHFQKIEGDIALMKTDIRGLKSDVSAIKVSLEQIIKILMSQTVSRTEVRELDHRVIRLEHHLKLA